METQKTERSFLRTVDFIHKNQLNKDIRNYMKDDIVGGNLFVRWKKFFLLFQ
ncbi:hypothetical protein IV57_GL000420 [Companilactobacillus kimchiensis]|uniref:Uncharacterized protein n=1 Tax=Companilactobacillus kimchiensis TaxID=993692 RepID=A0A0R2LB98_9LACO|nr:hypothetical protein IV57_GL000420 [Companilactobacillus kimchiensis]